MGQIPRSIERISSFYCIFNYFSFIIVSHIVCIVLPVMVDKLHHISKEGTYYDRLLHWLLQYSDYCQDQLFVTSR